MLMGEWVQEKQKGHHDGVHCLLCDGDGPNDGPPRQATGEAESVERKVAGAPDDVDDQQQDDHNNTGAGSSCQGNVSLHRQLQRPIAEWEWQPLSPSSVGQGSSKKWGGGQRGGQRRAAGEWCLVHPAEDRANLKLILERSLFQTEAEVMEAFDALRHPNSEGRAPPEPQQKQPASGVVFQTHVLLSHLRPNRLRVDINRPNRNQGRSDDVVFVDRETSSSNGAWLQQQSLREALRVGYPRVLRAVGGGGEWW